MPPSSLPLITFFPSGDNAILYTAPSPSRQSSPICFPLSKFHTHSEPSFEQWWAKTFQNFNYRVQRRLSFHPSNSNFITYRGQQRRAVVHTAVNLLDADLIFSLRSPSLEDGEKPVRGLSPVKKKPLIRRIALSEYGFNVNQNSPLPVDPEVPQTPVPPYRQTPPPVTVSQNYLHRLVADRWDAEVKRCEEARKAQLLEVQLAAHSIRKLV
ncbi:hypothetical protein DEU56DRAFT_913848 [Suillus clintonianus]|uniref:uncharacterized protein n=1 Tax=Suillus clintonianus TaxID=1904413 RepID=UPI001B86654C|nr:uncharacterized protein DEU56DRAFT_913848 [Suillus clintonianus]KAG2133731.1 hypothetical protein DEU56DRAFT_913848 [Suillus clintonianus]